MEEEERNWRDPRSRVRTGLGLGFEVGANSVLDLFSFDPTGASQYAGGTFINYLAQKIRGGEISQGELVAAGLTSLIPGGAQARALTRGGRFTRSVAKGGLAGGITTTSMSLLDEKKLPSFGELAGGVGAGGTFGGMFDLAPATFTGKLGSEVSEIAGDTGFFLKQLQRRVQGGDLIRYDGPGFGAGTIGAAENPKKPIKPKGNRGYVNRKVTLDREDVEYVPTKNEIVGVMKGLGMKPDPEKAAFINKVFKKDVKDIQETKKFLNDYFYRNTPKNLEGLAEAISAQEGVEYTVADLSNIIKNTEATTTRLVKGMPTSHKRIRNLVDLQRILKDRLRKLKQQPTFNKGHANSINNILKKFETGADRPDNIFIEEARSIYSRDVEGKIKLEQIGNISKKDIGDDALVVQRMKGFSPTVQESVLKLLRKNDLEVKNLYSKLGIDASDLDITPNIDVSTAVRPELKEWTEETVDDLVKSGVNPEKAVDWLLDINETLGDALSAVGLEDDMLLLFKKEPGLAAEFLNTLIGKKKRGRGKLANIPISTFERQMLASLKRYFKENPSRLAKFNDIVKVSKKGIKSLSTEDREKFRSRKITKKYKNK